MATVTTLKSAVRGAGARGRQPYMVQQTIDLAAAATAKGSALAANDIIEAITVPAETLILTAGFEMTASVQTAADGCTANLGVTGVDVTRFVSAFDIDDNSASLTSGVGYATMADASAPIFIETEDTIDWELQAATTAPTEGKVRVFAVLMNMADTGDMAADEVARDNA
jgi:hypothetical protein